MSVSESFYSLTYSFKYALNSFNCLLRVLKFDTEQFKLKMKVQIEYCKTQWHLGYRAKALKQRIVDEFGKKVEVETKAGEKGSFEVKFIQTSGAETTLHSKLDSGKMPEKAAIIEQIQKLLWWWK